MSGLTLKFEELKHPEETWSGTSAPSCGKEPVEMVREELFWAEDLKHTGGIIIISLIREHPRGAPQEGLNCLAEKDVDGGKAKIYCKSRSGMKSSGHLQAVLQFFFDC